MKYFYAIKYYLHKVGNTDLPLFKSEYIKYHTMNYFFSGNSILVDSISRRWSTCHLKKKVFFFVHETDSFPIKDSKLGVRRPLKKKSSHSIPSASEDKTMAVFLSSNPNT